MTGHMWREHRRLNESSDGEASVEPSNEHLEDKMPETVEDLKFLVEQLTEENEQLIREQKEMQLNEQDHTRRAIERERELATAYQRSYEGCLDGLRRIRTALGMTNNASPHSSEQVCNETIEYAEQLRRNGHAISLQNCEIENQLEVIKQRLKYGAPANADKLPIDQIIANQRFLVSLMISGGRDIDRENAKLEGMEEVKYVLLEEAQERYQHLIDPDVPDLYRHGVADGMRALGFDPIRSEPEPDYERRESQIKETLQNYWDVARKAALYYAAHGDYDKSRDYDVHGRVVIDIADQLGIPIATDGVPDVPA